MKICVGFVCLLLLCRIWTWGANVYDLNDSAKARDVAQSIQSWLQDKKFVSITQSSNKYGTTITVLAEK